jgi:Killing trait
MAEPTTVNPQITDAVTQSNIKVVGEAPAYAMGSIYQALAHSTGILFENAIAAQQQQNILAIAATNQGIMQLYALNTTAAAGAIDVAPRAEALNAHIAQASADLKATATAMPFSVNPQIEAAVKLANESALENASAFAYALRANSDAMAACLRDTGEATQRNLMRILQTAATAACLEGMLQHPQNVDDYQKVMETIKRLV